MFKLLVALSFYQITNANVVPYTGDLGPLLETLKAVERAVEAVASKVDSSKSGKKQVLPQSDANLNLEDAIKEEKLRQILKLILENNKVKLQDVNDESRGPRVFMIKENLSEDYGIGSEDGKGLKLVGRRNNNPLRKLPHRYNPDLKTSNEFEKHSASDQLSHMGQTGVRKYNKRRDRSFADDEESYEYATKKQDTPKPFRQNFPKYTDGINFNGVQPQQRVTPKAHKPKYIPYNYSKEEKYDGKVVRDDDSLERTPSKHYGRVRDEDSGDISESYRSYDRPRDQKKEYGRTAIPFAGNRNIYEK